MAFLARYADREPNTKPRYTTYWRGFLAYLGIPFTPKVKVRKRYRPSSLMLT